MSSNSDRSQASATLLQGGIDVLMLLLHVPPQVIISIEALTMVLTRRKWAVELLLGIYIVYFPMSS